MADSQWPPEWRTATDKRGVHHAHAAEARTAWCGEALDESWTETPDRFGIGTRPRCGTCWNRTGGARGYLASGVLTPVEDIVALWEARHIPLTAGQKERFIQRPEVQRLQLLPLDVVKHAFGVHRRLAVALPVAERLAGDSWPAAAREYRPKPPAARPAEQPKKRKRRKNPKQPTAPRPEPGFDTGTRSRSRKSGSGRARPVADFGAGPKRTCNACGRPESVCACR